jgi:hypothetical protein
MFIENSNHFGRLDETGMEPVDQGTTKTCMNLHTHRLLRLANTSDPSFYI